MRRATQDDVPWIMQFLQDRVETSMFPLANLTDHGLDGTHNRAVAAWVAPNQRGVFCLTNDGMLQLQLPDPQDWAVVPSLIKGREIVGCTGEQAQATGVLTACGLTEAPVDVGRDEPLMRLSLSDLTYPDLDATLAPLSEMPATLATEWRAHYMQEVLGAADDAQTRAKDDVARQIAADSHRCLFVKGQPVAVTGFNACFEDVVQIGGVYTPPDLRGKGYAGVALARHLLEARENGARLAILFAASDAAQRAYERVGFQRCGTYSLYLFSSPQVILCT